MNKQFCHHSEKKNDLHQLLAILILKKGFFFIHLQIQYNIKFEQTLIWERRMES